MIHMLGRLLLGLSGVIIGAAVAAIVSVAWFVINTGVALEQKRELFIFLTLTAVVILGPVLTIVYL